MNSLSELWSAILNELQNGLFYFASPWALIASILDVLVTTLVFYYILILLSDTQAWQLLKGLLALIASVFIGRLLGLATLNYIFVTSAPVLAVGLIIIFQPELRRALESFGRRSSDFFRGAESSQEDSKISTTVEAISVACADMASNYVGALIIIERETKLSDLIESGTVILDADLTSTALRQIFYPNSPMHDGAVIIRDGKIYAARVHVPLGDSYHLKRELGTRHRAAIGASEIGDTISVVVSEEHGTISVAIHGRLYTLEDADVLHTVLYRLLDPSYSDNTSELPRKIRQILRIDRSERMISENVKSQSDDDEVEEDLAAKETEVTTRPHQNRASLFALSLVLALGLWLYVRVTTNPVVSRSYNVQVDTVGVEILSERQLDYYMPESEIRVVLEGREQMLDDFDATQIEAYVDFSDITSTGTYKLDIHVGLKDIGESAYTVHRREPSSITVSIYSGINNELNPEGAGTTSPSSSSNNS